MSLETLHMNNDGNENTYRFFNSKNYNDTKKGMKYVSKRL